MNNKIQNFEEKKSGFSGHFSGISGIQDFSGLSGHFRIPAKFQDCGKPEYK